MEQFRDLKSRRDCCSLAVCLPPQQPPRDLTPQCCAERITSAQGTSQPSETPSLQRLEAMQLITTDHSSQGQAKGITSPLPLVSGQPAQSRFCRCSLLIAQAPSSSKSQCQKSTSSQDFRSTFTYNSPQVSTEMEKNKKLKPEQK